MFRVSMNSSEIRDRIADDRNQEKVHQKQDNLVNNNTKKEHEGNSNNERNKGNNKKRFLTIDGVIDNKEIIEIKSSNDELSKENCKGVFLDIRE